MKSTVILSAFIFLLICMCPEAGFNQSILQRAKQKIKQRSDAKVDKSIDDALDKAEGKKPNEKRNGNDDVKDEKVKTEENQDKDNVKDNSNATDKLAYNSKYDFVPGEKIIAYENFDRAEIGDFPTNWNTNSGAEIVTLNNLEGKWLKIGKKGVFHPEFINNLPENFTLEFDVGVNNADYFSPLSLNLANLIKPEDFQEYAYLVSLTPQHAVHLEFKAASKISPANSKLIAGRSGTPSINNSVDYSVWDINQNKFAHISLWRQAQRLRVYLNGQKIWDSPRAFDAATKYNAVTFAFYGPYNDEDYYLLSNLRLAIGAPDTRNKLLNEGRFITRGILFDVNSDKIKPESAGVLKEIGTILKENPSVKIKIVGHTDSDGDNNSNLELSKRRAASVKNYLSENFNVPSDNMQTDGKGESEPADKNTTAEAKANNRRVEFIKL